MRCLVCLLLLTAIACDRDDAGRVSEHLEERLDEVVAIDTPKREQLFHDAALRTLKQQAEAARLDDPFVRDRYQIYVRPDFFALDREWMNEFEDGKPPAAGWLVLSDIEAYFLYCTMAADDRNVMPNKPVEVPDGMPVEIGYSGDWHLPSVARGKPTDSEPPFEFSLTSRGVSAESVALVIDFQVDGRKETRGPVTVRHDQVAIFFLDQRPDGIQRTVMITPRIGDKEEGG